MHAITSHVLGTWLNSSSLRRSCRYCLVVFLIIGGCTSHSDREALLRAHSLDSFLEDRPQAAKLLLQNPALEHWLSTEWNRPVGDYRLVWGNDEPSNHTSECSIGAQDRLIAIRVSKGYVPVDQLFALCVETCNAQRASQFVTLSAQARKRQITRKDFIDQTLSIEYGAVAQLKAIFPKSLALSTNEIASTSLYRCFLDTPLSTSETWLTNSLNYKADQDLYGREYDQFTNR